MAKDVIVLCPECLGVVEVERKALFFRCPHCDASISTGIARQTLEQLCMDPAGVSQVLNLCLNLEKEHGPEVPMEILELLQKNNPYNEEVAYARLRMSGYPAYLVKQYLDMFAGVAKKTPFAAEFLDKVIDFPYAYLLTEISLYVENKVPAEQQKKYKEKIAELKTNYTSKGSLGDGMILMYLYYLICSVINVIAAILIVVLPFSVIVNIVIAVVLFCIELFILFLHNRSYGNRLGMDKRERILISIFLASILIAIASIPIGWLIVK